MGIKITSVGTYCQVFYDEKFKVWQLVGGSAENECGPDGLFYSKYAVMRPYEWIDFEYDAGLDGE